EDIEVLQQGRAIAVHVKDAASDSAHRLGRSKISLGKMQRDGVSAALHHRNGITEMSEALRDVQLRVCRTFDGSSAGRPRAAEKVLVRQPYLSRVIAINRVTRRNPNGEYLAHGARQNLQCVDEAWARALEGQVQDAILRGGDIFEDLHCGR